MKRLTGQDALFLSLETPAWHQHVGGLTVLDPEGRGITYEQLLERLDERLVLAPKFRWKLRQVPLGIDRPAWVDDPDFDVRRHVRRIAVPSPGGARETAEVAGTLLGIQLDRRRPLWELWYMEGLAHGRVALLMKYHHCLLDGVSGASLATVLMDLEPDPPPMEIPTADTSAGADPNNVQLLLDSVGSLIRIPGLDGHVLVGSGREGAHHGQPAAPGSRESRPGCVPRPPRSTAPSGPDVRWPSPRCRWTTSARSRSTTGSR